MRLYTNPYTRAQYQLPENETYSVYIRRSNGSKRLVFVSKSPEKAFEFFHKFQIYLRDIKYIYANTAGPIKDGKKTPLRLETMRGTDQRPLDRHRLGRPSQEYYKTIDISKIINVPETLINQIKKDLKDLIIPGTTNSKLTRNRLIPMLLAYFSDLDIEQKLQVLHASEKSYISHRHKSGANLEAKTKDLIDEEIISPIESGNEDDLL